MEVNVSAVSVLKSQRHSSATRESHGGRGFFHQRPILKKVPQTRYQDAAHAQKRVTVPFNVFKFWPKYLFLAFSHPSATKENLQLMN